MEMIMKAIVQMGIFMICAQVLVHFRPNGAYEKYLKLLVSAMVLIQIMAPVVNLVSGQENCLEERIGWFEERLQMSMEKAEKLAIRTEERLHQMTLEEIREKKLKQQATDSVSQINY